MAIKPEERPVSFPFLHVPNRGDTLTIPSFPRRGFPKVCNINNQAVNNGLSVNSGCQSGGTGFLCDAYAPTPVTDDLSYGFATMSGTGNCCKCFQLTWTSGNARGKQMVVQNINLFEGSGDVKAGDIVILTPGGGNGPNEAGCRGQYGTNWYVFVFYLSFVPSLYSFLSGKIPQCLPT